MSARSPLVVALIDALSTDPDALDQLAAALAPRLTALASPTDGGPITADQAARRAGLHARSIRRALAAGTLTGHTIAGRWRIETDDLDRWLKDGAPTSATPTHRNGRARAAATAGADAIAGLSERAA